MKTRDRIAIDKAIVTIGEILKQEGVDIWSELSKMIIAKDEATDEEKRRIERIASKLRTRLAEVEDMKSIIENFDDTFHATF